MCLCILPGTRDVACMVSDSGWHDIWLGACIGMADLWYHIMGYILFANHKANGVVTNIGFLGDTVDDTGSYMAV